MAIVDAVAKAPVLYGAVRVDVASPILPGRTGVLLTPCRKGAECAILCGDVYVVASEYVSGVDIAGITGAGALLAPKELRGMLPDELVVRVRQDCPGGGAFVGAVKMNDGWDGWFGGMCYTCVPSSFVVSDVVYRLPECALVVGLNTGKLKTLLERVSFL